MKKLLAFLLCCMMILPAALAETDANPPLTFEEIEMYKATLLDELKTNGCEITANEKGNYLALSGLGDITISTDAIKDDTHILGARLSVNQACLRGLKVGDTMEMIFQVYPNDNPTLQGSYYEATLCIFDNGTETCRGYALREGQRVSEIAYVVYNVQADGIVKTGVRYVMDQGYIQQIDLFTAEEMLTQEEMKEEITTAALIQEETEYHAYLSSQDGSVLDPFCREDLAFSGLDFYTLTPEDALSVLGSANVDEWNPDSDNSFLRTLQWDGITMVSKYDADKKFSTVYSFSITNDTFEGPRGLRVGDYFDTVLYRFRHSEGSTVESGILLYGDGENAPYGKISYSQETNNISYTVDLDGEIATLYLTFRDDALQEIQLFINR